MLKVDGLDAYRGPLPVLFNLTLAVPARGFVAILGANGAGKSTLLHTISGTLRKATGSITFNERPILHRSAMGVQRQMEPPEVVDLGVIHVPERFQLFTELTVTENIKLGAWRTPRREVPHRLGEVFDLFPPLAAKRKVRADALSGGEQQMVAIARALMADPRLIMLDEPSTGLAPLIVRGVFEMLARLNQERGCAILVVEQNVNVVLEFADYAYILECGRIARHGAAVQLRSDPSVKQALLG